MDKEQKSLKLFLDNIPKNQYGERLVLFDTDSYEMIRNVLPVMAKYTLIDVRGSIGELKEKFLLLMENRRKMQDPGMDYLAFSTFLSYVDSILLIVLEYRKEHTKDIMIPANLGLLAQLQVSDEFLIKFLDIYTQQIKDVLGLKNQDLNFYIHMARRRKVDFLSIALLEGGFNIYFNGKENIFN